MSITDCFRRNDIIYGLQGEKDKYYAKIDDEKLKFRTSSCYHFQLTRATVSCIKWHTHRDCFSFSLALSDPKNTRQQDFYDAFKRSKYKKSTLGVISLAKARKNGLDPQQSREIKTHNTWVADTDLQEETKKSIYMNIVRRVCKYTLWFVIHRTDNNVHFVLDNFDIKAALDKKTFKTAYGSQTAAITGSEIKFLFRIWGYLESEGLSDRVKFYENNKLVSPPWQSNPAQWNNYAHFLIGKHCSSGETKVEIAPDAMNATATYTEKSRVCYYDLPARDTRSSSSLESSSNYSSSVAAEIFGLEASENSSIGSGSNSSSKRGQKRRRL